MAQTGCVRGRSGGSSRAAGRQPVHGCTQHGRPATQRNTARRACQAAWRTQGAQHSTQSLSSSVEDPGFRTTCDTAQHSTQSLASSVEDPGFIAQASWPRLHGPGAQDQAPCFTAHSRQGEGPEAPHPQTTSHTTPPNRGPLPLHQIRWQSRHTSWCLSACWAGRHMARCCPNTQPTTQPT